MSLKTFFQRLWNGVKKIFNGLKPELKEAIAIGVKVVEGMKNFIESPGVDVLTAIIPGTIDDKIKVKLREFIPKILVEMKLAANCTQLTDPNEIAICAINTLQQIKGDWISDSARKNFFDSLAVLIAQVASDGKLDWNDAKVIIKWYYDHKHKAEG